MKSNTYAVAYCRYSSENQREESISAQKRAIEKYAHENNLILLKVYSDSAQSGTTANRKEFLQMIEDSKSKNFTKILVHKLDRFSRDKDDTIFFKSQLHRNNIKVVSVTEKIDNSPEGILMESVIEGIAAYYSRNLSRETLKGMRENAYNSKNNGGTPPFGYKLIRQDSQFLDNKRKTQPGVLALHEENSIAVKLIFDRVLEGKTYTQIVDELKYNGYKNSNGSYLNKSSLLYILKNEKYTGVYIFGKYSKECGTFSGTKRIKNNEEDVIRVEGGLPKIIDTETFLTVQKLLQSRVRKSPGNKIEKYLLSNKIYCGECNTNFAGERQRKVYKNNITYRIYYRCLFNAKRKCKTDEKCKNFCVRRNEIEKMVLTEIKKVLTIDKNFDSIFNIYEKYKNSFSDNSEKIEIYNKKLKDNNLKINNLIEALSEFGINESLKTSLQTLEDQKTFINKQIIKLQNERPPEIIKNKVLDAYKKILLLIENENESEIKQKLVDIFLNKVVVYEDKVEILINALPSLNNKDYGLEITTKELSEYKKEEAEINSSSSQATMPILMDTALLGSPQNKTNEIRYYNGWFSKLYII